MSSDDTLFVQSIARAFKVLEAFQKTSQPLSLSEIAERAGTSKSNVQRVCHTLLKLGYLERDDNRTGLLPGKRLLERSFDFLRLDPLVERATPVLADLRRAADERVDFSLFDDVTLLYAIRNQSKRELQWRTVMGRRVPTFCTSGGRAILARLDDAHARDILERSNRKAYTPHTITAIDAIMRKVQEARDAGYAVAVQEVLVGEVVVAAAVTDRAGRPVGAVHIAGSLSDWTVENFTRRFSPLATGAARAISEYPG